MGRGAARRPGARRAGDGHARGGRSRPARSAAGPRESGTTRSPSWRPRARRCGRPSRCCGFDTSELERQLLDKLAERDSAQKELEKRQTSLEIARRDRELQLAEAEARQRKAPLKVDVPAELVAAKELRQSREDLALASREVAYLKESLRLESRQGGPSSRPWPAGATAPPPACGRWRTPSAA